MQWNIWNRIYISGNHPQSVATQNSGGPLHFTLLHQIPGRGAASGHLGVIQCYDDFGVVSHCSNYVAIQIEGFVYFGEFAWICSIYSTSLIDVGWQIVFELHGCQSVQEMAASWLQHDIISTNSCVNASRQKTWRQLNVMSPWWIVGVCIFWSSTAWLPASYPLKACAKSSLWQRVALQLHANEEEPGNLVVGQCWTVWKQGDKGGFFFSLNHWYYTVLVQCILQFRRDPPRTTSRTAALSVLLKRPVNGNKLSKLCWRLDVLEKLTWWRTTPVSWHQFGRVCFPLNPWCLLDPFGFIGFSGN